jgi:CheY-like chemotaxis protein
MGASREPISVLCVDDEAALRTAAILEREGETTVAEAESDPERALERVRRGEYDCLVCEYELPGTDGIELLEAVREVDPEQPVILFTGSGSETIASEAISSGVTDYVRKGDPEGYERLADRVEQAGIHRREKREHERSDLRLESFADTVVHDLRGPLTAAAGYLDLARQDGETCPFLEEVDTAHGRMERILEELPALVRAVDGGAELEPVSIAAAAEAGWLLHADAEATLEVRVPAALCTLANRDRFVQFFERVFGALLESERGRHEEGNPPVGTTVGALDGGFFVEIEDSSASFGPAGRDDKNEHEIWHDPRRRIADAVADAHGWRLSAIDDGRRLEITGIEAV